MAAVDEKSVGLGRSPSDSDMADGQVMGVDRDADVVAKYGETHRGLSPRHVQLMAIGGSIGVGIGGVLSKAGPLSVVLGYAFWGLLYIWPLNLCVAEMCAYLPIRGTIFELARRFVDPALGFAMGWTYFFAGLMLVCTEYAAVATIMQYWSKDINPAVWIAMAMVLCIMLNVVAVKWYGESEFIMASTKVILLFGLIILTIVTMAGGNPQHDAYGFRNWGDGNYIHPYLAQGDAGRFLGWWKVVIYAGFTIAGPDMIALAAGEIVNPRRTIPRVAKLIFYRLVGFYFVGVLCVGIICSSRDPRLMGALADGASGAAASPWVIGIENLGIRVLPHIINAAIMLSGWSCGNAYLYSASRTLYGLARDNQAPQFLLYCTKQGVPLYCVLTVSLISCITFLVSSNSAVEVFFWFVDLTTTALIMTYTMMMITFIGFYRARKAQGMDPQTLPFLAPFTPYSAYLALFLGCVAVLFVGFDAFGPFNVRSFITAYFALAFGVVMFVFWKVFKRTKLVDPREADLYSGKKEVDEECRKWEEGGIEEVERASLVNPSLDMCRPNIRPNHLPKPVYPSRAGPVNPHHLDAASPRTDDIKRVRRDQPHIVDADRTIAPAVATRRGRCDEVVVDRGGGLEGADGLDAQRRLLEHVRVARQRRRAGDARVHGGRGAVAENEAPHVAPAFAPLRLELPQALLHVAVDRERRVAALQRRHGFRAQGHAGLGGGVLECCFGDVGKGAVYSWKKARVTQMEDDTDSTTANHNIDIFRDCVSAVLVERLSQREGSKPKKKRSSKRSSRRKSTTHQPDPEVSGAGSAETVTTTKAPQPQPQNDDAEELSEFIGYVADTTFDLLPSELRLLTHRSWIEDPSLADRYSLPLTGPSLTAVLPTVLDPDVSTALSAHGDPEDLLAPVVTAYVTTATAAPVKVARGQADECELCGRDWIHLTYHHLIPRMVHEKVLRRGWHREDELQNVAWLCRACHNTVHRFASHEDLARHYYTVDLLMAQDEIAAFAQWVGRLRWKGR
ncbi:hypothetical protein PspLS_06478 [Pyricularia sp. CBS 133598]|nr:hypothetical protein PspLS_06478 [Pyricularia sp. CBS 133598]